MRKSRRSIVAITKALLDTHTFLWAMSRPERLSRRATRLLADPGVELYLSAASIWEIELKHRTGKIQAGPTAIDQQIAEMWLGPRSMTVREVGALTWLEILPDHKDPFDRLIAAQAIVENLPLITADEAFRGYGRVRVEW